jgi:hypothetical protein
MKKHKLEHLEKYIHLLDVDTANGIIKNRKSNKPTAHGYLRCKLKDQHFFVHQVIAVAGGLNTLDKCINHIDGNKLNNRLDNLEAISIGDNVRHARDMGLIKTGEDAHLTKYSNKFKADIKREYATGNYTYQQLADKYNVSYSTVARIARAS